MSEELTESFYRFFEVIAADTPELLDEVFRLRYQVYCVENDFEAAGRFPDGREYDRYDNGRAVYSIVRHRSSGLTAATVRLVLADPADEERPFPIEENCAAAFEQAQLPRNLLVRAQVAEISRFAVSKHFKRRAGEANTVAGIGPDLSIYGRADRQADGARVLPHLILGLFAAIVRMSAAHDVKVWYAVMERSLLRLLTRFGIEFKTLGGPVDYHGLRQPCYGVINQVLSGIWEHRPDVWRMITDDGKVWPLPPRYRKAAKQKGRARSNGAA